MNDIKDILQGLKAAMISTLQEHTATALKDAHTSIVNKSMQVPNSPSLLNEKDAILARFVKNIGTNFDALVEIQETEVNVLDYASLSLVEEDDLEAIIAMEGMIAHARNCDIPQYVKFNTRLDSMFFGSRIDESNNPMDPEQIGEAFKEAIRPVGMPAKNLLVAYRSFNTQVFHRLESIMEAANAYLASRGVLADMDVAARDKSMLLNRRNKQRQKDDPIDRAFRTTDEQAGQTVSQQDLFPLVRKLLHRLGPATAGAESEAQPGTALGGALQQGMMVGSRRVEVVSNKQLLGYLSELEARLDKVAEQAGPGESKPAMDLRAPLGDLLEEKGSKQTLCAVNAASSDIIQLVTLLYEAIWRDETVPIPIKELIGRTQISTLKMALKDPTFFDTESHPLRVLLNELATAGITWTQPAKLDQDAMYQKIKQTIKELIANFNGDLEIIEALINEFREFKKKEAEAAAIVNSNLSNADEREQRISEIQEYAHRKIDERVLDKELHPDVRRFLNEYFHKFLVQVILREGPGGISWRPVMNTIDVLLWTVQRDRQKGDLERFIKLNTRLRTNLAKALDVAGIDADDALAIMRDLQAVQDQSFKSKPAKASLDSASAAVATTEDSAKGPSTETANMQPDLPADDEHLLEVDQYPIGLWFEFQVDAALTIRCALAAKIETIEKFVFVNRQGVKVIEKSRMGLARELKAGTVKVICDGPLIDRAMEAVIAQLRDQPAVAA